MSISALRRPDGPTLVKGVAALALAAGIGVWGALLLAPAPQALPPALDASSDPGRDITPVARWFGGAALRVRVAVVGLIAGKPGRGTALLSINGGPVQAYGVGQALAPGVALAGITSTGVSIDQDGVVEHVPVAERPSSHIQGFIRVSPSGAPVLPEASR